MYYNYRKPIILDLEECPLLRGLLYCVSISECPLLDVLLYILLLIMLHIYITQACNWHSPAEVLKHNYINANCQPLCHHTCQYISITTAIQEVQLRFVKTRH